ncbi:hypothetical protein Tco_0059698 [Tanacetum coccineum]
MPTPAYAQLVDTDTESEPEEAPSKVEESHPLGSRVPLMGEEFEASEPSGTRTISSHSSASSNSTTSLSPGHPLTQASPTPTPTRVSFHRRIARMAMCTQLPGSFYETSSPTSSLTLPVQKRYWSTFELIEDTKGESSKPDSKREGSKDESSDSDDEKERERERERERESHGLDNESQEDEGPRMEEEAVPEGQQQVVLVVDTAASEPLGLGFRTARCRSHESTEEIASSTYEVGQSSRSMLEQEGTKRISAFRQPTLVTWVDPEDGRVYTDIPTYVPPAAPVQTPPSLEWSPGSLLVLPSSLVVPSPIASPVATLAATMSVNEDQFLEVGAQLELYGSILHDHTQHLDALPPSLFEGYDRDLRELYTRVCPIVNAPAGRLLGAYDLRVTTPRAVVHAGNKTSGDARSWYMISGDVKSWVCFDKGKWMVLEIKDVHLWGFEI